MRFLAAAAIVAAFWGSGVVAFGIARQVTGADGPAPTVQATVSTRVNSSSHSCIMTWCLDEETEMCLYDGGTTGWDPMRGPVPGITATPLGPCPNVVVVTVTLTSTDWIVVA